MFEPGKVQHRKASVDITVNDLSVTVCFDFTTHGITKMKPG